MPVTYAADGAIGTITLDNPPANSYDIELMRELADAIGAASADAGVRVVVLRSASERFFSAGADVKRFLANDLDANMDMIRLAHEALASIARSPKLFVAWIAGHALGGGLEMALACDLRYAAEGPYRLGTPEVTLGLLPGNGGTQRLPRLIAPGPALELLLTGRRSARTRPCASASWAGCSPPGGVRGPHRQARGGPAAGDRPHQARRPRGHGARPRRRTGARARAHRGPVPLEGRRRGPRRVQREARAGVRGA